jgi:hypothetical protein
VSVASLDTRAIAGFVSQSEHLDGLTGFLFGIIPVSFFDAFAKATRCPSFSYPSCSALRFLQRESRQAA